MKKQDKVFCKTLLLTCLVVVAGLVRNRPAPAVAQAPTTQEPAAPLTCIALDVVFLIDQSDSMSGAQGAPPTDPFAQREFATEFGIEQLVDVALDQCPDTVYRVGVVSYGTTAQVDLPMSEIDPTDLEQSLILRDQLTQNVRALEIGQTNPRAAFDLAAQMLDDLPPLGDGIRKRVIIFITDGIPYLSGEQNPDFSFTGYADEMRDEVAERLPLDQTLLRQQDCLDALQEQVGEGNELPPEQVNACLETYFVGPEGYRNSTYIYTLLLRSGQVYPESLLGIFREMTEAHGGRIIGDDPEEVTDNTLDVPSVFRQILDELTGVQSAQLSCGNFAVNPYLERATLVIFKLRPDLPVQLSYVDATGVEHVMVAGVGDAGFTLAEDFYQHGNNERYNFLLPYPGLWKLSSDDCDGLDAYYSPIEINPSGYQFAIAAALPQRDRAPFYDQDQPTYLEYQMLDDAENIVDQEEDSFFAVTATLVVTHPDGTEKPYTMVWNEGDKLFRASEPLQTPIPGRYTFYVRGSTPYHEGEAAPVGEVKSEVFNSTYTLFEQSGEFEVFPVTSFSLEILAPQAGEALQPIHDLTNPGGSAPILPIPVRARLVDRAGQPTFNLGEVFDAPAGALVATVTAGGDSATATLSPDPNAPGELIGQITGFDGEGDHHLEVNLVGEFNAEFYPDNRVAELDFTRTDEVWRFNVLHPAAGSTVRPIHDSLAEGWPLPTRPLTFSVQLVDASGQPYGADSPLLDYAPAELEATITAGEVVTTTTLQPVEGRPGYYTGEARGLEEQGEHRLEVRAGRLFSDFAPQSEPAIINFQRSDWLYTAPLAYNLLLALILLYVAFRIYRFFAIRTNPVRGSLLFMDGSTEIADFGLYSGKNTTVFKRKVLRNYPMLDLKELKVSSAGKPSRRRRLKAEGEEDVDFGAGVYGDDGLGVDVTYTLESGHKATAQLSNGAMEDLGDGTFRMMYKSEES